MYFIIVLFALFPSPTLSVFIPVSSFITPYLLLYSLFSWIFFNDILLIAYFTQQRMKADGEFYSTLQLAIMNSSGVQSRYYPRETE